MKPQIFKPSQGKILISDPFLNDFYFKRSVVFLAEHDEKSSFGLILNKPLTVNINDILTNFPKFDAKLFLGGPIQMNSLFMLHTLGEKIENSFEIINGLYWGGNFEQLKKMIRNNEVTPEQVRFYIGYSGWEPKQLDYEIEQKSWAISTTKLEEVFDKCAENLWSKVLKKLGNDYAQWINYPIDPMLN